MLSKAQSREKLWRQNRLGYLLRTHQLDLRNAWRAQSADELLFVLNCSRRFGKSRWMCTEAIEAGLKYPMHQMRYAAPTKEMVHLIIRPHIKAILADCPKDIKPKWRNNILEFHNGSQLHIAGCDKGGEESLRGTGTDIGFVDEAAFIKNLDYVVNDILVPQTLDTGGRMLIASTPPKSPAHPFRQMYMDAKADGCAIHRTIFDNPYLSEERIALFMKKAGGEKSSTWRREYLGRFVVDKTLAVVPEFEDAEPFIVTATEPPEYYHAYVAMDVGYSDLTVALFGYLDFERGLLVIQDEAVFRQSTSDVIDDGIREKELALWSNRNRPHDHPYDAETHEPVRRVVDAPLITMMDLRKQTARNYSAARKDDADAALNRARLVVQRHQVRIHPRCEVFLSHMRNAIWTKSRRAMDRSDEFGHFDGVDTFKYLVRHVDWDRNPFPPYWVGADRATHMVHKPQEASAWAGLGKVRKRGKRN